MALPGHVRDQPAHGGIAGILRDQAPVPLCGLAGVDALIVSTENTLT
jgi:hypothetical protein